MNPKPIKKRGEEHEIQEAICTMLRSKQWLVMVTHGNMYQHGFPDLYCCHRSYGQRWVEVKKPVGYVFTPAQLEYFQLICANGGGVWILTAATETEYAKLFDKPNWSRFLPAWRT